MALVEIPGGMYYPPQISHNGSVSFTAINAMSSENHKYAVIFQVPKSGTLDWFEVRQHAQTTAPDPGLTFSFQNLTAGNDPDGTMLAFRNLTTGFGAGNWLVPPGVMTDDGTDGGVKLAVTRGDWLACVISYTPTYSAGNISISHIGVDSTTSTSVPGSKYFYPRAFTTSWLTGNQNFPIMALKYNDGTYAQFPSIITPLFSSTSVNFNSGSTPNHRGILFSLPAPVRVNGVYFMSTTTGDLDIILYDASDNVIASISLPANLGRITTQLYNSVLFPTAVNLVKDTNYRLIIKPTTSTSGTTLNEWFANSAALRAAFPMGAFRQLTTGAPGAWTEDDTSYGTDMGLIIDAIGDDSGGGGGGGEHSAVF